MQPGLYNIELSDSALYRRHFKWQPGGQDADPSGWTGRIEFRKGAKLLLELTTTLDVHGSGLVISGQANDPRTFEVDLIIKTATAQTFDFKSADYDFYLRDAFSEDYPFLKGSVNVTRKAPA